MTSSAPYYQSARSTGYHEPTLHAYAPATDADFGQMQFGFADAAQNVHVIDENGGMNLDPAESNTQLAGLLEAVNSATGHDGNGQALQEPSALGKRKRDGASPPGHESESTKRARPGMADAQHPFDSPQPSYAQPSVAAARAAGVHSAAALFRSPSASTAKKYTRPPMSKLYASLHLAPEDFLHLQAAAKTYMLDPNHPERQDCVGSRGKGDTDMVKLKLFNCVRDFLADGVGERFFPDNAEQGQNLAEGAQAGVDGPGFGTEDSLDQARWVWPRDGNQIVSLVTPLMRRMVTNERQRQYAIESRKGGSAKKDHAELATTDAMELDAEQQALDPELHANADVLASPTPNSAPSNLMEQPPRIQGQTPHAKQHEPTANGPPPPNCATNVLQFIFTRHQTKLLRFDWPNPDRSPLHAHMTFNKLTETIAQHLPGIREALAEARSASGNAENGARDHDSDASTQPPTPAQLAKRKAKAALLASEGGAGASAEARPRGQHVLDAAPSGLDEASEELRRELQLHALRGTVSPGEVPRTSTLADLRVDVRALTPGGFVEVSSEEQWEGVKRDVAASAWLEGCLRVAIEVL